MSPAYSGKGKHTAPERRGWIKCKKKRRSSAACSSDAAAVFEGSDSWASLNEDLLRLVAWRVLAGDFADYIRLRAVCRRWRSSTVCPRGRGVVDPRFHPRHWMLLPEGYRLYPGHTKLRGRVRFFNLRTGAFVSVHLPLFRDHFAMDSVDGLLLLQRDHDMAVRLLHPFTGDIVELPSLSTLLPQLEALLPPSELAGYTRTYHLKLMREVTAAVNCSPNGAITAMLAFESGRVTRVAFATSEDQRWTFSSWETSSSSKYSIMSLHGKLYFCSRENQIFVVDPHQQEAKKGSGSPPAPSSLPPPKLIATFPSGIRSPALVECESEVLLVGCSDLVINHVEVYRIADAILGRFTPMKCIGDNSLFVTVCRSLCVSSKAHPSIVGDSVVMQNPSSKHLAQYNLRSGTWSTATDGEIFHGSIPSPYSFIHHIFTCCLPCFWNKGQIFCSGIEPTWGAKTKWRIGG